MSHSVGHSDGESGLLEKLEAISLYWHQAVPPGVDPSTQIHKVDESEASEEVTYAKAPLVEGLKDLELKDQNIQIFPDENGVLVEASGKWGATEGNIVFYARRPVDQPFNFVTIASVSKLNPGDVLREADMVNEVKTQLVSWTITCSRLTY